MKNLNLIAAGLTLALTLAACGSASTPAATTDPAPLGSAETVNEIGGSVASDTEQLLASLTDGGTASPLSVGDQATGCRTADPAASSLNPAGKPLDSDNDGVPDLVTWIYTGCTRAGTTLNGRSRLSDPNSDPALAGSFLEQPMGLSFAYTRADGTVRTVTKNGSSTGTLTGRSSLNIVRDLTETTTDTLHPTRQATWKNGVTVQFTAAPGASIDRRSALPAGTVSVNGPREWHVTDGGVQVDRYLTIATTTPLAYDPTCDSTADRIFGTSHARSGAFNVLVYSDAARTALKKTITVTYTDCAVAVTSS